MGQQQTSTQSGLSKSKSETALLHFAQSTADKLSELVQSQYGIDVTKTTRKQINRPSFIAKYLDTGRVSFRDP